MDRQYNAHESTYVIRDQEGNVKSLAPCYAEEEDSMVTAVRAYEREQLNKLHEEALKENEERDEMTR